MLATAAFLMLPALAGAQPIGVSGYPVTLDAAPVGSNSATEPAISPAPDGSDAEWFVVSGRTQNLLSISPTGRQTTVASGLASDAGAPVTYASVNADGYDWILDNDQGPGNVLYAVGAADSPNPGLNPVARFGDYGQDITLGPDGALYVSDNDGIIRCQITAAPSATCSTVVLPPPFYTGAGAFGIDGGGNAVWFTDGMGELGAYSSNAISGPYPSTGVADASTDPGTIVTAPNGYIYMAGGASTNPGGNNEIVELSPGDPQEVRLAASSLGNVVAMTIGPDGDVWFLDAGTGTVDQLNVGTNVVSVFGLPSGLYLPQSGWRIASGPSMPDSNGDGEVFFTATTASSGQGNAAVGEVTGIPFPLAAGALAFDSDITVSKRHRAVLTLACAGQSNAACQGAISLNVRAKVRVRVQVRAARKGHLDRYRTMTQTKRLSLAKISYNVRGGHSVRSTLRLSNAVYNLLEHVVGHRWKATVSSAATVGTVSGTQLTMTGPAPKVKPKPKPKPKHRPKPKPKHNHKHRPKT